MTPLSSAIKQRDLAVRTAWWAGKVVNHRIPRLLNRVSDGSDGELSGIRPPAGSSGGLGTGVTGPVDLEGIAETNYESVLIAEDVTDYGSVDFVADPFLFPGADRWHMFFEVVNTDRSPDAVIGHATSPTGIHWEYDRVVLTTDDHLSFPYVFEWKGGRYMIPETGGAGDGRVKLYEAVDFPGGWRRCAVPVDSDHESDDAVAFRSNDRWWLLVGDDSIDGVHLYSSPVLVRDGWQPHPANPVVVDRPTAARPAGRPLVTDDGVVVFYQDCENAYGERVRAYEVTTLDEETFTDRELSTSPILEGSGDRFGWNSGRMHHIDPWYVDGRWICAVDGNVSDPNLFTNDHWSIGIAMTGTD